MENKVQIKQLSLFELPFAAKMIRESFMTVAKEFGITVDNCPKYTGFITNIERLQTHLEWGWLLYGLFEEEYLIGYVSLSKEDDQAYELHNLAVLPNYRHKGYGKRLLDYAVAEVKRLKGNMVTLSIIEENQCLKDWYTAYGFNHVGIKKYEYLPFTSGYMKMEV